MKSHFNDPATYPRYKLQTPPTLEWTTDAESILDKLTRLESKIDNIEKLLDSYKELAEEFGE